MCLQRPEKCFQSFINCVVSFRCLENDSSPDSMAKVFNIVAEMTRHRSNPNEDVCMILYSKHCMARVARVCEDEHGPHSMFGELYKTQFVVNASSNWKLVEFVIVLQ